MNRKTFLNLYRKTLIDHTPLMRYEIDQKIKQLLKTGMKKTLAVKKVASDMGVCERTIWRACKAVTQYSQ